MMSVLVKLFFNLAKELMKGCRRLNRWAEEHYDLIETEAVAVNGPPDGWTYSIGLMSLYHM
jgi:hypothetical protein